jgi:hypothetical protein
MLALALLAGTGIVVVEARVGDDRGHAALARDISTHLGALPSATVLARLSEASSPLSSENRVEPILEADRLIEKGKDDYLEGHFPEAIEQLEKARGLMSRAVETVEEERQAAEALFRAELYLAFTLRAQGAGSIGRARDVMRDAIRTFPNLEPPTSEYGPENLRFFLDVKKELERGAMGQVRIRTIGAPANVYLNGRLVGVTPLDLQRVYPGSYRLHMKRGNERSRLHAAEIRAGNNEFVVDIGFDNAVRDEEMPSLVYPSVAARAENASRHAARLAEIVGASGAIVYSVSELNVTMTFVDVDGLARTLSTTMLQAPESVVGLREGHLGTIIQTTSTPRRRVWTWVVGGVAVATLATAVVLGRSFQSDLDSLNQRYPDGNVTNPADLTFRDDARTKGDTVNILYGVAGAAAVGTIVLYFVEGGGEATRAVAVTPVVSPTFAGAEWKLRF